MSVILGALALFEEEAPVLRLVVADALPLAEHRAPLSAQFPARRVLRHLHALQRLAPALDLVCVASRGALPIALKRGGFLR